jgi:hypothetical protein
MFEKKPVSISLSPLVNPFPGSYVFELGVVGLLEKISLKELPKSLLLAVVVLIIIKKYNNFLL